MALQQTPPSGRVPPPANVLKGRAAHPDCPKCARSMTVAQINPVMFATDIDDVIYRCEDCGTEAKRSVKRG